MSRYPCALDDVLTRVPLIVRTPGGLGGVRIAAPVAMMDITPTLLELAGFNLSVLDPMQVRMW